jgi:hypothetical protein
MTYTDRQVANLTAALIKAEAYISSGRVHSAHETIITALGQHRSGLATMDQITAFDNSIATIGAAVNYVVATSPGTAQTTGPETAA